MCADAMARIPEDVQRRLLAVIGMTAEQCDATLQLISLPENGTTKWTEQYNYIEALHDGRGYTVTLYGACSGTGDLYQIFQHVRELDPDHPLVKFMPALKKCHGDFIDPGAKGLLKAIPALGADPVWRRAVWRVYIDLYWTFAAHFAAKTGPCTKRPGPVLATPLAKGWLVDCALNHGGDMDSFKPILKRMKRPDAADPAAWLADFMAARHALLKSGYEDLDTSKTGDRATMWLQLITQGNVDLKKPIRAYRGYWGRAMVV